MYAIRSYYEAVIRDSSYYIHGLFDFNFVQSLLDQHLRGKNDHSRILWLIFVFNIWHNRITSYNVCYTKLLRAEDGEGREAHALGDGAGRITSYNLCYTKLLRPAAGQFDLGAC